MTQQNTLYFIVGLATIGLGIAAIIGWVLNISAIIQSSEFSGMLVARVVGAFIAPLGAVLGYF